MAKTIRRKRTKKRKNTLPKLRVLTYKTKKHKYKLSDPHKKRILAIEEGINREKNKTKKSKREAAVAKKARFNVLRIYRKNKKPSECKKLTQDMKYIDKKYGLGETKDICIPQKGGSKKLPIKKNINNKPLKACSVKPMTGYYRNGYCMTGVEDKGTHTVCAKMDKKFLEYTKSKGNDLYSVVKPGDKWCLCENRWNEAYLDNVAPKVIRGATNMRTKKKIRKNINETKKEFLYNPDDPSKSFDVYIDKDPSDTIPIKYTSMKDVKDTIQKLERLYKKGKYSHKRIWQVGMIMYVRLKVLKDKKPKQFKLSERYFKHLGKRTKIKGEPQRKKFIFTINM
jgi:uncharacterized protein